MNAQETVLKKINFYTDDGLIRIRYLAIIGPAVVYIALNVLTFLMAADGGKGHVDMFFHAPLTSLLG